MAAKRFSATFKASGAPTTQGRQQTACFFYLDDATSDADVLTVAQAIATLCNGDLVSLTSQIYSNNPAGPWSSLTANGGSSRGRLLFRSSTRRAESLTVPYLRQNVTDDAIEAVFESGTFLFLNSAGEVLGDLVNIQKSQIIE